MVKIGSFKVDLDRVAAAVGQAETRTAGEIVPMIVEVSGEYSEARYLVTLIVLTLGSLAGWLFAPPWVLDLPRFLVFQLLLCMAGWFLGSIPGVVRLFAGSRRMEENVELAAHAAFLRQGLTETRERTGVLIYISLLERRVEILGDKGIHEKVGKDFWHEEVNKLARGIRERRTTDALLEVIGDIGRKLSEHFPQKGENPNELPDHLRS